MDPHDDDGKHKILWWIIVALTSISFGAGSSWLTRLDGFATLRAEVQYLSQQVQELKWEIRKQKANESP